MGANTSIQRTMDQYHHIQRQSGELVENLRRGLEGNPPMQPPMENPPRPESRNSPMQVPVSDVAPTEPSMLEEARRRLSSLSEEMQELRRRGTEALSAGDHGLAQHLLSQAERHHQESQGISRWLNRGQRRHSSGSMIVARTVVHSMIPPPCRWGIYCCGQCCCCCCFPSQLNELLV
eukprot:Gregarina_sp_Poly_1__7553@NODE_422_length_8655_cov_206_021076_g344_i0_p6_GENE_NODE_422_length_8655_cov_206_021076_g344_i0NODE_422_length_8655_cov_206_021076_g344_i0_p6_ORF_typecomplete_len177_score14_07TSKS/PF15358_6/0_0058PspA_IM30/PF04012_12/2_7e03PspA_IM30/PF04012_12/0_017DUF1771/PF08590_10/0_092DUF3958/PF13125_6/3_8DUF3958/PF13125_6/2_4e02HemY_N/PF07219_13/5_3_NODE_422_length_8655_cov_206_021076_g344_i011801710